MSCVLAHLLTKLRLIASMCIIISNAPQAAINSIAHSGAFIEASVVSEILGRATASGRLSILQYAPAHVAAAARFGRRLYTCGGIGQ